MVSIRLIWASLIQRKTLYLFWILSLSFAVTGLLVIDVYRRSLTATLTTQGRHILTADLALTARRSLSEEEFRRLRDLLPSEDLEGLAQVNELFAMVSAAQETRLGMIRFISDGYPLTGNLKIETDGRTAAQHGRDLGEAPTAWVAPDLLTLLNQRVGDWLRVGHLDFKIVGIIRQDSSQTFRIGNMAPRVYVHQRHMKATGLLQFGSTYSETHYVGLRKVPDSLKSQVSAAFPDSGFNVTTPADLEQGSLRTLSNLMDYLGLIGLVTLALGWIGVYYLGRRWLAFEVTSSGILKTLGFTSGEIRRQLLIKLILILSMGVVFGGTFSWLLAHTIMPRLKDSLPAEFELIWSWKNTLLLLLIGPLAGFLFLFYPIFELASAKPAFLLSGARSTDWRQQPFVIIGLVGALLFAALTLMQARSWYVSAAFLSSLVLTVLLVVALGLMSLRWLARVRRRWSSWSLHLATAVWTRRPASALLLVTVSTLAGLLAQLIPHVERTLVGELKAPKQLERPALFLFDIQDEQMEPLKQLLTENGLVVAQTSPFIRARILSVNGQAFERSEVTNWSTREEEVEARFRNRGVNLSYRRALSPSETITAGKSWEAHTAEPTQISVEERYAERVGLKLGDRVRFDVQGVEIDAEVASLRQINWNSFQPNFFIQFPEGILDGAPKTWILTIRPHSRLSPPQIQLLINSKFANVTSINIDETLTTLTDLMTKLSQGLTLASRLALSLGLFVFIMILLFQLLSTERDWAQLRIQGLGRGEILRLQILTYGTLGLVGSLLGAIMSAAVAAAIARFGFSTSVRWDWLGSLTVLGCIWFLILTVLPWLSSKQSPPLNTLSMDNPNE